MTQIITSRGGGSGGGGGSGDMLKCVYDPNNCNADAFDYCNFSNTPDLSCYQTKDCMVCDLTGADNSHYPSAKAVADAISGGGAGDMLKSVYDPNNVNADAFDYCNFSNTPTIPTDNCQLANGCCYTKTCDIPTDNCQLANGCGYTTCTGTLTASNISNTAYGSSWSGVTTVAPSKNAVYAKVNSIDALIPSAATCSNQLADKDYVNDSINSVTAYYITKDAAGNQFATYAELAAATTFYSGGAARTPTRNDYTIVLADENYDNATTRYIYNSGWEYQYTIHETALTQAQLDALNSGITAAKVSAYDAIPTITDNCQLCNGCGYTTCTGTITGICMNGASCGTSGVVDLGTITPGITKIFTLADTSDLTTAQAAYDRYVNGGNPIIEYGQEFMHLQQITSTIMYFSMFNGRGNVSYGTWEFIYTAAFTLSSGVVTAMSLVQNIIKVASSAPTTATNHTITLVI